MKIYTIAGWSNSGKTTLIIKLIKVLKNKGLRVLALKNASEKYYLEPEGKDSLNFLQAGADSVYLTSKKEIMKMELIDGNDDLFEKISPEFHKYDIVLLEGLRKENIPIIEVFNKEDKNSLKIPEEELCALISDYKIFTNIPFFKRNDIEKIVRFILL